MSSLIFKTLVLTTKMISIEHESNTAKMIISEIKQPT